MLIGYHAVHGGAPKPGGSESDIAGGGGRESRGASIVGKGEIERNHDKQKIEARAILIKNSATRKRRKERNNTVTG